MPHNNYAVDCSSQAKVVDRLWLSRSRWARLCSSAARPRHGGPSALTPRRPGDDEERVIRSGWAPRRPRAAGGASRPSSGYPSCSSSASYSGPTTPTSCPCATVSRTSSLYTLEDACFCGRCVFLVHGLFSCTRCAFSAKEHKRERKREERERVRERMRVLWL